MHKTKLEFQEGLVGLREKSLLLVYLGGGVGNLYFLELRNVLCLEIAIIITVIHCCYYCWINMQ